jgi:hypothetical protein
MSEDENTHACEKIPEGDYVVPELAREYHLIDRDGPSAEWYAVPQDTYYAFPIVFCPWCGEKLPGESENE